jgi:hypothetical protein
VCAGFSPPACRPARDERKLLDTREHREAARERELERSRCLAVRGSDQRQQPVDRIETRLGLVDPVPREIPERDRRHAQQRGDFERERRDIADDKPDVIVPELARLIGNPGVERGIELARLLNRRGIVMRNARGLDDPAVARAWTQRIRDTQRPRQQRRADGGTNQHTQRWFRGYERVDDLDFAGGVAEAVAADEKNDCHWTKALSGGGSGVPGFRGSEVLKIQVPGFS